MYELLKDKTALYVEDEGIELIKKVRETYQDIPIVVISAYAYSYYWTLKLQKFNHRLYFYDTY